MTRTQAIAIITEALPSADEETLAAAAALFQQAAPVRALSERERALLAQSKADFATGATSSHAEMVSLVDHQLAHLGVPKSTA